MYKICVAASVIGRCLHEQIFDGDERYVEAVLLGNVEGEYGACMRSQGFNSSDNDT